MSLLGLPTKRTQESEWSRRPNVAPAHARQTRRAPEGSQFPVDGQPLRGPGRNRTGVQGFAVLPRSVPEAAQESLSFGLTAGFTACSLSRTFRKPLCNSMRDYTRITTGTYLRPKRR